MSGWYYVQGKDRVGPVDEDKLHQLFERRVLNGDSYIWKKGLENWTRAKEILDLESQAQPSIPNDVAEIPAIGQDQAKVDWKKISENSKQVMIKVGVDRGCAEAEYGPYSIDELRKALHQSRINERTYIFVPGMENWAFLGDLHELYKRLVNHLPPEIDDIERRAFVRKPFVARLYFHNEEEIYEGICRDVSIGGGQILIANFPGSAGDLVKMNVHPENSNYSFVATGRIVRLLEGNQGFSLRFINLSEEAQNSIKSYLDEYDG